MDSSDPSGASAEIAGTEQPEVSETAAASTSPQPNPFWSERVAEEFRIRKARPLELAEYDDEQAEPDYFGCEAGRSAGFASIAAASVRAASPAPGNASRVASEVQASNSVSNPPWVTSRSRSPAREDLPSVRELIVTLGGAIVNLADEQRTT